MSLLFLPGTGVTYFAMNKIDYTTFCGVLVSSLIIL